MLVGLYSSQPQSGKSTVKDVFISYGFAPMSLAEPVKQSLLVVLIALGVDNARAYLWGDKKSDIIPELGVTGGYLMSHYATDFFRETVNQDVWLNCLLRNEGDVRIPIVVDDMRFPNEYAEIDFTVRILRPDAPQHDRSTKSEAQLDKYRFDYTIINSGSLKELKQKAEFVVFDILNNRS